MHRKLLLILTLCSQSLVALSQRADTLPARDVEHELQSVVVVGARMPEIKQRSAASITIIPARDIREMSQILPDMQAIVGYFVPGVPPTGNNVNERYNTLRGRSILVLIDGIPQSTPLRATSRDLRTIDPAAVERIEVIKGASISSPNRAVSSAPSGGRPSSATPITTTSDARRRPRATASPSSSTGRCGA